MSRTFIKSILIAAVTVTGISLATASPAKAGNDDLAKFLFGATALIIIGKAISDSDAKAEPVYRPKPVKKPKPVTRPHRKALPASCLRVYHVWDGRVRMLSKKCLENKYRHSHRLPAHCKITARTEHGVRRGYKTNCLRQAGYYLASK